MFLPVLFMFVLSYVGVGPTAVKESYGMYETSIVSEIGSELKEAPRPIPS
jgi:hypothetical protein